jgi:hypothetical protein
MKRLSRQRHPWDFPFGRDVLQSGEAPPRRHEHPAKDFGMSSAADLAWSDLEKKGGELDFYRFVLSIGF